jgi:hypothetical protein
MTDYNLNKLLVHLTTNSSFKYLSSWEIVNVIIHENNDLIEKY